MARMDEHPPAGDNAAAFTELLSVLRVWPRSTRHRVPSASEASEPDLHLQDRPHPPTWLALAQLVGIHLPG